LAYRSARNPHVVKFYGGCLQPCVLTVHEFCTKGSVYDVLNSPYEVINWNRVFKIARDTIKGLFYLHNCKPPIIHRNLKTRNLLVSLRFHLR
jgi:serine/threonine protein kinase